MYVPNFFFLSRRIFENILLLRARGNQVGIGTCLHCKNKLVTRPDFDGGGKINMQHSLLVKQNNVFEYVPRGV